MHTQVAAFIVSFDGPPLDYTALVNLQSADITVLDELAVRVQLEATDDHDALARVRYALADRPYVDFEVVGGVRVD